MTDKKEFDIPEVPKSEEPGRKVIHLYGIAGWYLDNVGGRDSDLHAVSFGGYFKYEPATGNLGCGQIIDMWGTSTIEGKMDAENLEFTKIYDNHKNISGIWGDIGFKYQFKKINGIWAGEYHVADRKNFWANENCPKVKAVTTPLEVDAYNIIAGKPERE
jgi:hypothetical protein